MNNLPSPGGRIETYQRNESDVLTENSVRESAIARSLMDLTATPVEREKANLLGDGFLRRKQGLLFVGATGIGKSSFLMQAAVRWSLGEDHFGIRPARPLTVLIVQAENDDIDLVEMRDGIVAGLKLSETERAIVARGVHVLTEFSRGQELLTRIAGEVQRLRVDLFIFDPAFAYVPGAVKDQEVVTYFCRALLQPFIVKNNVGVILAHHANKPPTGREKISWQAGDFAYAGAGSAEFANWARGVLYLRSVGSAEVFELRVPKRGKRAGLCDGHGKPIQILPVRHAKDGGIFWQVADPADVLRAGVSPEVSAVFKKFHGMKHDSNGGVSVEALATKCGESKRNLNRRFADGNRLAGDGEALVRRDGRVFLEDDAA